MFLEVGSVVVGVVIVTRSTVCEFMWLLVRPLRPGVQVKFLHCEWQYLTEVVRYFACKKQCNALSAYVMMFTLLFYNSAGRIAKRMSPTSVSLFLYVGGTARVVYCNCGFVLSYILLLVCTVIS